MADRQPPDRNTVGGRVRRYARVGGTVGGLAARLAGNRLFGLELDKGLHAADLQAALGGLKGPLMKVAQILATVPDLLPEEYVQELRKLQTSHCLLMVNGYPLQKQRIVLNPLHHVCNMH